MEIKKAEEVAALVAEHKRIKTTLQKLEEVREFTSIVIKGEDGAERESSIIFSWQKNEEHQLAKAARTLIKSQLESDLREVETKLQNI